MKRNALLLNVIAKTMNAAGSAIVSAFDAGSAALTFTMSALLPGEEIKPGSRIKSLEKKIQVLFAEIVKETSRYPEPSAALEAKPVIDNLNNIKELDKEIKLIKQHIANMEKAEVKADKIQQRESNSISSYIVRSIAGILPGEKASLQSRIFTNEKKIKNLYCNLAKESSKSSDLSATIMSEAVAGIIAKINELVADNSTLKLQIEAIAEPRTVEK